MGENSKIEWTDHTFNPWIGCTKVGPGCDHCYAEALSNFRLGVPWGAGEPRRRTTVANWRKPLAWDRQAAKEFRRYRVFCASLADVFDNEVDPAWRRDLLNLIGATVNLDWLLLTKRIGNVEKMVAEAGWPCLPGNVWMGATMVNQAEVDRDWDKLMSVRAIVRFASFEPLLGPIVIPPFGSPYLDWAIVGGESGKDARPMDPAWAKSLRDQCERAGVPFLFKQWGEWADAESWLLNDGFDVAGRYDSETFTVRVGKKAAGRLLDGRTHDGFPA